MILSRNILFVLLTLVSACVFELPKPPRALTTREKAVRTCKVANECLEQQNQDLIKCDNISMNGEGIFSVSEWCGMCTFLTQYANSGESFEDDPCAQSVLDPCSELINDNYCSEENNG